MKCEKKKTAKTKVSSGKSKTTPEEMEWRTVEKCFSKSDRSYDASLLFTVWCDHLKS